MDWQLVQKLIQTATSRFRVEDIRWTNASIKALEN